MAEEQPKVTVYWLDHSRAQRILWLLEELNLPYELEIFHRDKETMLAPPELEKVHALGKSPVVKVTPSGPDAKPVVLAESGFMTQYLTEHFSTEGGLMPTKWRVGQEGKVGGETEEWLRYQYILHYCEGSLMPILVMALVIGRLKSPMVPFFVRPITSVVANRVFSMFIFPNARRNMKMLDGMLATSSGKYLCGDKLTAADVLMSFPLIAAKGRLDEMGSWEGGSWVKEVPNVKAYIDMLENEPGYKRSVKKIEEIDGREFVAGL